MRTQVESLSEFQLNDFLIYFWQQLTIAGRAAWSDERLDQETQLHLIKWLNEIQCHVPGHASVETRRRRRGCLIELSRIATNAQHWGSMCASRWTGLLPRLFLPVHK